MFTMVHSPHFAVVSCGVKYCSAKILYCADHHLRCSLTIQITSAYNFKEINDFQKSAFCFQRGNLKKKLQIYTCILDFIFRQLIFNFFLF